MLYLTKVPSCQGKELELFFPMSVLQLKWMSGQTAPKPGLDDSIKP